MNHELTPVFDDDAIALVATADAALIPEMTEFFETASLGDTLKVTVDHATDDAGNTYRQLQFIATARWHDTSGDTWISGAGFELNVGGLVRRISEILDTGTASQDVRPGEDRG